MKTTCWACAVAQVTAETMSGVGEKLPAGFGRTEYLTALSHVLVLGAEQIGADLCPDCTHHLAGCTMAFRLAMPRHTEVTP